MSSKGYEIPEKNNSIIDINTINISGFSESVYRGSKHKAKAADAIRKGIIMNTMVKGLPMCGRLKIMGKSPSIKVDMIEKIIKYAKIFPNTILIVLYLKLCFRFEICSFLFSRSLPQLLLMHIIIVWNMMIIRTGGSRYVPYPSSVLNITLGIISTGCSWAMANLSLSGSWLT